MPMAIPTEEKGCLEKVFNLEKSDLVGVPLSAGASMAMLGAYYYLQPLGDTLALSMGLEFTPLVTIGNMTLIVIVNPIYAAVVRKLPTEAVVGVMFSGLCVALDGVELLLAARRRGCGSWNERAVPFD